MDKPTRFTSDSNAMEFNKAPEKKTAGARLEFDSGNIRTFVDGRGIKAQWESSWLCTCRNTKTLAPDVNCPICGGKGIAFLPAEEIKIIVQSQEKGVINGDLGLYDSGTAIGTTTIGSGVGFRDRITLPDVLLRQSLIFNIDQKRLERGMKLTYDVKQILLAKGSNGRDLTEGVDFTVDYINNMFYPKETLLGQIVSLNMLTVLRYYVIDFLKENRYQYTEKNRGKENAIYESYPKKLLLKREDIFVTTEAFTTGTDIAERGKLLTDKTKEVDAPDRIDLGNDYVDIESQRLGNKQSGGFFGGKLNG